MKHRYLAIETSSPRLSIAAGDDQRVLARYEGPLQWRHAESLFGAMRKVLAKLRWPVQSLTGVAVSTGPGSFTGIRIGLAAARALGQTLQIPVVGVNSLEAIAQGCPPGSTGQVIVPLIDALRGKVFSAAYQRDALGRMRCRLLEQHVDAGAWAARVRRIFKTAPLRVAGNGWLLYKGEFQSWRAQVALQKDWYPKASALLELARPLLAKAGADSYKGVLPFYLRQAAVHERQKLH
jgi:tRNA threonylcarbamoyl adenosine modification protein YeaZ